MYAYGGRAAPADHARVVRRAAQPGVRHADAAVGHQHRQPRCASRGGAWRDWFTVDNGTNLENAEGRHARDLAAHRRSAARGAGRDHARRPRSRRGARGREARPSTRRSSRTSSNTLGSAGYLVRSDPAGAEKIIDNLIPVRHSLPRPTMRSPRWARSSTACAPISEIMVIRMGARLGTQLSVPDALKSVRFPP